MALKLAFNSSADVAILSEKALGTRALSPSAGRAPTKDTANNTSISYSLEFPSYRFDTSPPLTGSRANVQDAILFPT